MILTNFTRPVDPISCDQLCAQIQLATGKVVSCSISPTAIDITGPTIVSGDTSAIQTVITAYKYTPQPGDTTYFMLASSLDDGNMATASTTRVASQRASYAADLLNNNLLNAKTAIRYYVNGVSQNGTVQTGDVVEWISTLTTAGGTVTDYVTTQGAIRTSGGTALLSSVFPDSIQTNFIDSTGVYAQGNPTITSSKTVSIPFTKQGFSGVTVLALNVLGSVAMNAIPDGVVVKLRLVGIAA